MAWTPVSRSHATWAGKTKARLKQIADTAFNDTLITGAAWSSVTIQSHQNDTFKTRIEHEPQAVIWSPVL